MKLHSLRAAASLTAALTTAVSPLLVSAQTAYEFKTFKQGLVVTGAATAPAPGPVTPPPPSPQPALQMSTSAINFGDVATNTTETRQVLVSNTGTGSLSFTAAPSVTGDPAFSAGGTSCGASLAAGADCLAEASFSPTAVGAYTGVLKLISTLASSPHEVSLSGSAFNPVSLAGTTLPDGLVGQPYSYDFKQLMGVSNEASPNKSLATWSDSGALPTGLSLNATTGVLSGIPSSAVARAAYTVTGTYKNNRAQHTYSLRVDELRASFSGSNQALNFGTVEVGAVAPTQQWTFVNSGTVALTLQLSGLPDGITLVNGCTQVAPGASCDMALTLQTQAARAIAQTTVTVTGPGASALSQTFTVQGTVVSPVRQVVLTSANPSLNFGWQTVGATAPVRSWVFQNQGNVPMTLSLSGLPAGVSQQNGCVDVASYGSCTISLSLDTTVERTIPATPVSFTGDWSAALGQALSVEGGVAAAGFKQVTAPVAGLTFSSLTFYQGLFYSVLYGTNPVVGTGSFLYASSDGKNWVNKGRIQTSAQPANGIAFSSTGRILVAGLSSGSTGGKVAVSDNGGSTWTVPLSTGGLGTGVAINDAGVAVFTAVNIAQGYRSTNNGTTWTTNAVSDSSSGSKIVSNRGAQFATLSGGSLRYSLDSGASWTQVFAGGGSLYDLMYVDNKVWFAGAGGATPGRVCSVSLGGTPACSLISGSPTLTALTAGNGVFVVGTSTNNLAYKSTDGTTWSPITGLPDWPTLAYGNGLYVGVRSQNAYVAVAP